eukprot:145779-Chlamydomonas_euryale.AAC.1
MEAIVSGKASLSLRPPSGSDGVKPSARGCGPGPCTCSLTVDVSGGSVPSSAGVAVVHDSGSTP